MRHERSVGHLSSPKRHPWWYRCPGVSTSNGGSFSSCSPCRACSSPWCYSTDYSFSSPSSSSVLDFIHSDIQEEPSDFPLPGKRVGIVIPTNQTGRSVGNRYRSYPDGTPMSLRSLSRTGTLKYQVTFFLSHWLHLSVHDSIFQCDPCPVQMWPHSQVDQPSDHAPTQKTFTRYPTILRPRTPRGLILTFTPLTESPLTYRNIITQKSRFPYCPERYRKIQKKYIRNL